jgi:hypothetical protein
MPTVIDAILDSFNPDKLKRLALCAQAHGRTIHEELVAVMRLGEYVERYRLAHGCAPDLDVLAAWHREHNEIVDREAMDALHAAASR